MVRFTIPGKVTSANRVTRHVGKRSIKSESARIDCARISELAFAARFAVNWTLERCPRASVSIKAMNSRLDADNLSKCILDGIKSVLIVNDSPKHLGRLVVEHHRDKLGERYDVTVEALS